MSLFKEAAIVTGDITHRAFCVANNLVNPNKARVMTIIEGEGSGRHVAWQIVYQNLDEVIDIPTYDIVDDLEDK